MTNHLHDTSSKRFYFDRAFLSVLPDTSGFKLTWSGAGTPRAKVSKKTSTYTLLELDLAARIYSGKSATYRLVFDMVDAGGTATRDLRIGTSLASFPVWAFATDSTPGSSVRVVFPAGYQVEVESGEIPNPTVGADGVTTFQTGKLATPLTFFAYLVADRPGSYVDRKVTTDVGTDPVVLTVQSWADDDAWSKRVGDLMVKGLPVLSKQIGMPWPRARRSDRARIGQPLDRRLCGAVRPDGGDHRRRLLRRRFRGPPRVGACLVQRLPAHRSLGRRGVRLVLRARGGQGARDQGDGRCVDRRPQDRADPAQRVGRHRSRGRQDRGLRVRRDARPRPRDRGPRRAEGAPGGLGRRGRRGRRLSAADQRPRSRCDHRGRCRDA